jgi:hypothetical protein
LGDDKRKADAQDECGENADQDDLAALLGGQARGKRADDDCIVAGQHQIDHQHREKGGQRARLANVGKVVDDRVPHLGRSAEALHGAASAVGDLRRPVRGGHQEIDHHVPSVVPKSVIPAKAGIPPIFKRWRNAWAPPNRHA